MMRDAGARALPRVVVSEIPAHRRPSRAAAPSGRAAASMAGQRHLARGTSEPAKGASEHGLRCDGGNETAQQPPTRPPALAPEVNALSAAAWEPLLSLFSATCLAVFPEEFFCAALAPSCSNISIIRALPSLAAVWSGYVVLIIERFASATPPLKPCSFRKAATAHFRALASAASRSKRSCSARFAASARSSACRSSSACRALSSDSLLACSSWRRHSSSRCRCISASTARLRCASSSRKRACSCSSSCDRRSASLRSAAACSACCCCRAKAAASNFTVSCAGSEPLHALQPNIVSSEACPGRDDAVAGKRA
mmetsp:Transcript_74176/g.214523  ORF Transcript_74176/g.214523 Transcript_74176/m.214523 type:complete len:312 (-) Transcript_74176:21-956(-)